MTTPAIVIGEAFVDLIAHREQSGALVYVPRFGGSPLNVAVGMRRLGAEVQLATTTAQDTFGRQVSEFFLVEGVDAKTLSTPVAHTVVSLATPTEGRVSYEYLGDVGSLTQIRRIPPEVTRAAPVLHASSTALNGDPAFTTVREAYRSCQGFRSIDPNPRPSLIGDVSDYRKRLETTFADVDLIKVSREDLEFIYPGNSAEASASALHRTHAVPVIVTQAAESTMLILNESVHRVPVPNIQAIDATGAGDSFIACLLAHVWKHRRPDTPEGWVNAIRWSNSAAAHTCEGVGGAESMPHEGDLVLRAADADVSTAPAAEGTAGGSPNAAAGRDTLTH